MIQNDFPSPILLARFETTAKDFLYPYSSIYIEYIGLRRYVLLSRTIDFPGISPSFEFSTSPSVVDVTGLTLSATKTFKETKTVNCSKFTLRENNSFLIVEAIEITYMETILFICNSVIQCSNYLFKTMKITE